MGLFTCKLGLGQKNLTVSVLSSPTKELDGFGDNALIGRMGGHETAFLRLVQAIICKPPAKHPRIPQLVGLQCPYLWGKTNL